MHALLKTGNKHIAGNGFSGNPLAKDIGTHAAGRPLALG